ncbi:MAG: hypothetical protein WCB67_01430 [Solirubrobacteraceae bacterium]
MLQAVDDYPFHQSAQTFDTPTTDDVRWFDRYWFMTGDVEQRVCVITGIGTYPNARRIDAYAMVGDGEHQWNLRVGRERSRDPLDLSSHGLRFELADAMSKWRLDCDGLDEFGFSLEFDQRYPPNNLPALFVERAGQVIMEMGHFAQGGGMRGDLRLGERKFRVDGWPSQRDHSWGRRPPSGKVRSGIHVWLPAQVGDREIWLWFRENASGERKGLEGLVRSRDGHSWVIEDVEHDIEVKEEVAPHRQLVRARLDLRLSDGQRLHVEVEPLVPIFIAGGGYVDGAEAQGTFEGQKVQRWSIADNGRAEIPNTIIDHFSRVTVDGEPGQGVFELSLGRYEPLGLGDLPG